MASPGSFLVELAQHIEARLIECGRNVSCVDLAFGSSIVPPQLKKDCDLQVDVGPDQNPYRAIDLRDGSILYDRRAGCNRGWRFNGVVRVTMPYPVALEDCCHEDSVYTYLSANTLGIVSEAVASWLDTQDDGESTQTQFVSAFNGGAITVNINFSMRVCMPSCEELLEEERLMVGELDGLRR